MFTPPCTTTISMTCNVGCRIDIDTLFYLLPMVTIGVKKNWKQSMSGIQWRHSRPYRCLTIHERGTVIQTGGTDPEDTERFFRDRLDDIARLLDLNKIRDPEPWDIYITTISSSFYVDQFVDLYTFAYKNADECTFEHKYPALHWRFRDKKQNPKRKHLLTEQEKRKATRPTCCLFAKGCVILTGVKTLKQREEIYQLITRAIYETVEECRNQEAHSLSSSGSTFKRESWQ